MSRDITSINSMMNKIDRYQEQLASVDSYDFDPFKLSEVIGRENLFAVTIFKIMNELPCPENSSVMINNDKLISFLNAIYKGYKRDV